VGWSIDRIADAALVNSALNMAAATRSTTRETIIHADHGAQFTSWAFTSNVRNYGLKLSLGTVGDCYDCQSVLVGLLVDSEDLTSVA
jgi:transposase InsO family protein